MRQVPSRPWVLVVLVLLFVGGAVAAGTTGGAHATSVAPSLVPSSTSDGTVSAVVLFNGISADGHTSPSNAIKSNFNRGYTAEIDWTASPRPATITQGTLTLQFVGISLGTSSLVINGAIPQTNGTITLNTGAFTQDRYLIEGVYQLTAQLFDGGSVLYQLTFYVWIQATYHLTVVNVALIIIGIWEVYQLAALGSVRLARKELGLDEKKPSAPASTPPAGGK